MFDNRLARFAVLIDADNASPRVANGIFEEIANLGEASVRWIYGDFSSPRLKAWADILARHALQPRQQFANTTGKNASDIALVIEAMDLLHSGRFHGFCLVSSDSDFTQLAARIREQGLHVVGFGEQKTPESFRQACHRFIYTENLGDDAPAHGASTIAADRLPPSAVAPILRKVIEQTDSEDGWVDLPSFGSLLARTFPDFDSRTYGEKMLSDLVRKIDAFEVDQPEGGRLSIRLTTNPAQRRPRSGRRAASSETRAQ